MSRPFNTALSAAQIERLALLAEEMAETIQMIGKTLRHGFNSTHPQGGLTNRELIEDELGDVCAAMHLLIDAGDLDLVQIDRSKGEKLERVGTYLHFQVAAGTKRTDP